MKNETKGNLGGLTIYVYPKNCWRFKRDLRVMYDSLLFWLLILVLKRERKKRHFNIFAFNIQVQVA